MTLYSYVVRYDSAFAPNPFFGYCSLATCKPTIRADAEIGDWVVGTGSADKRINRGGRLVYAMKVAETLDWRSYDADLRFSRKKPMRTGSRKQSCGDNIYYRSADDTQWCQRDSFHANPDGSAREDHVRRDTGTDRILVGQDFYYFGGEGPEIPEHFRDPGRYDICRKVRRRKPCREDEFILEFEAWLLTLGDRGFRGRPLEWVLDDQ